MTTLITLYGPGLWTLIGAKQAQFLLDALLVIYLNLSKLGWEESHICTGLPSRYFSFDVCLLCVSLLPGMSLVWYLCSQLFMSALGSSWRLRGWLVLLLPWLLCVLRGSNRPWWLIEEICGFSFFLLVREVCGLLGLLSTSTP